MTDSGDAAEQRETREARARLIALAEKWRERAMTHRVRPPGAKVTLSDLNAAYLQESESVRACADELEKLAADLLAGRPEPPADRNAIAVKLAEKLAAHRDGQDGSDCSDINDPGSCDLCQVFDAAIRALSGRPAVPPEAARRVAYVGAAGDWEHPDESAVPSEAPDVKPCVVKAGADFSCVYFTRGCEEHPRLMTASSSGDPYAE